MSPTIHPPSYPEPPPSSVVEQQDLPASYLDGYSYQLGDSDEMQRPAPNAVQPAASDPGRAPKQPRTVKTPEDRIDGLLARNVFYAKEEDDPLQIQDPSETGDSVQTQNPLRGLKDMILTGVSLTSSIQERWWEREIFICNQSNEAAFQRTMMVELLNRREFDEFGTTLAYQFEEQWTCPPAPRKPPKKHRLGLKMPRPDLVVGFETTALVAQGLFNELDDLQQHCICPAGFNDQKQRAAMFFLSFEAKGVGHTAKMTDADFDNLNTASQALYNMWYLMKEANDEDRFYEKIRFFSISASPLAFNIRVHRARKVIEENEADIRDDYPLGFVHKTLWKYNPELCARECLTGVVRNVLLKYGVGTLLPIMKETIKKLANEKEKRRKADLKRPAEGAPSTSSNSRRRRTNGSFLSTSETPTQEVSIVLHSFRLCRPRCRISK